MEARRYGVRRQANNAPKKHLEQEEPRATEEEQEAAAKMVRSAVFNRPDTVRDKLDI